MQNDFRETIIKGNSCHNYFALSVFSENMGHPQPMRIVILKSVPNYQEFMVINICFCVHFFPSRYVILHIIDQDYAGENDSLGQVIIDLDNLDPNTGYHGSFALADLVSSNHSKSLFCGGLNVKDNPLIT